MAAVAGLAAVSNQKGNQKRRGGDTAPVEPNKFQPERQLRLIRRDEDGEIVETPCCPTAEGDTILRKSRSFCWNLYEYPENSLLSHYINVFIMGCIVLSALVMVIESVPGIHKKNTQYWDGIEAFFVLTFTTEFVMRVFGTPSHREFWRGGMNWVDLLSIVPWYLDLIIKSESPALKMLRLGRSLRLVKLSRYSSGVRLIMAALDASTDALYLFLFILTLLVVLCSSAVYYMERGEYDDLTELYMREDPARGYLCCAGNSSAPCETGAQAWAYPDSADFTCAQQKERSPFQSIPETFWWCFVTLSTVGYGDFFPVTYMGQVMGICTMLLGIITLALPISIIGGSFIDERQKYLQNERETNLRDQNTIPGSTGATLFPTNRIETSLQGMDYIEAELERSVKKCEIAMLGLIKLQKKFASNNETHGNDEEKIVVAGHTLQAMTVLTHSIGDSLRNIQSHLD